MQNVARITSIRTALGAALLAPAVAIALAGAASAATPGTGDPAANRPPSQAAQQACATSPNGAACISASLADINAAHTAEGVGPMVLPPNFASLTVPEQLFVTANLERVARGLIPAVGLAAPLNADATAAANRDADPQPTNFYGDAWAANWAGGTASTLEADFYWMYDDGVGSGNIDCTTAAGSGCWGHRHDILYPFDGVLMMGAGFGKGSYGPSMTQLFVGGDTQSGPGQADAPLALAGLPAAVFPPAATNTPAATTTSAPETGTTGPGAAEHVKARLTPSVVRSGGSAQLIGSAGAASAGRRVKLQAYSRHAWRTVATGRLGSSGDFSFRIRTHGHGQLLLRATVAGGPSSAARTLRII